MKAGLKIFRLPTYGFEAFCGASQAYWLVVAVLGTTKVQNNISVPGETFLKSISVKKLDKPHAEDSADAAFECLGSAEDRPGTSSPSSQGGRAALARNITVMEDDLSADDHDDHTVAKAWTPELLTKIGETQAGRTSLSPRWNIMRFRFARLEADGAMPSAFLWCRKAPENGLLLRSVCFTQRTEEGHVT